ncbi:MAG: ABC transporter permease, partial [Thermoproteales archaeon]|nr:ABC transporter permease [Thermoproteales archaeon]
MNYMRAGGVVKGLAKRAIMLYLTLVISMYITIVVANMGGLVDQYIKSQLILEITYNIKRNPAYRNLPPAEIDKLIEKTFEIEIKRRGLDKPFLVRSFIYLRDALTLDLGRAMYLQSDSGSRQVKIIILERLPQTIMLFTTSMLIHFFVNLFMGLYLARHYGSFLDKLFIALSPTSVIPGWFYGIFLILIFYSWLHVLPPGGIVDVPPPEDPILYSLSVLKHMILPLA